MVEAQNLEAEESVLGAMLLAPAAIDAVADVLREGDFYRPSYGRIYRAGLDLHAQGSPVDAITLTEEMDRRGELEAVGGRVKMHELAALVPATANAAHYAKIIRDLASKRKLIRALDSVRNLATSGTIEEALREAEEAVSASRADIEHDGKQTVIPLYRAMIEFEAEMKNPPNLDEKGVPTPFSFLGPMMPGRVYILAGYMKDGKTALSGQFTLTAGESKRRVGFASIEMSYQDLRDRLVCAYGVPEGMVRTRRFYGEYLLRANKALADLSTMDVSIIDDESLEIDGLRRYQKLFGFDLLIVDHLHRFDWKERRDLERIMRGIVNIAREFNIPVLLLAQLKRPMHTDRAPRPTMSMLRESGMIEAEASAVWFVYRERDEHNLRTNNAEFIVAADRYGSESLSGMWFNPEYVRFEEKFSLVG